MVKVLTSKRSIAVGCLHLKNATGDLKDRNVEGSASQVVHCENLVLLLVHAKRKRRGSRLVDDAEHVKACDLARILGGLTLGIVEISWNRDDGLLHGATQVAFCGLPHLGQNKSTDLARRILFPTSLDPCITVCAPDDIIRESLLILLGSIVIIRPANQTLGCKDGVLWIGHSLALRRDPHQSLPVGREPHYGRSSAHALTVLDDLGCTALHDRHAGIGGAQIDADHITLGRQPHSCGAQEASARAVANN
mmetsp:Transcript_36858/g.66627  ORF Transcript_36858/g.66627 Transcript_36858/m.66627 type:complete len:250 (-) Transcript_36858:107-856(-)